MFSKPLYQKLKSPDKQSVIFMVEEHAHFTVPWHFHPEIEILLVLESTGITYVGDGIVNFKQGDIAIIGENIPHWWRSDNATINDKDIRAKALIIQFPKEIFVGKGKMLPYTEHISDFILRSERGIWFEGHSRQLIADAIKELFLVKGIERTTRFIHLLDKMARSEEYKYLAEINSHAITNITDFERFNKVYGYIIHHFRRRITLDEVARLAKISPTAFCRYFKSHTGKTFASFINEFRIDHACKLLIGSRTPVSKVAKECGFNNISNFNEQFRKLMKTTPIKYRKHYSLESARELNVKKKDKNA